MENQKSYNKKNFNYLQFVYIAWIHAYIDFYKIYEQAPYVIDLESEINSLGYSIISLIPHYKCYNLFFIERICHIVNRVVYVKNN